MSGLAVQAYGILMSAALAAAGIPVGPGALNARATVSSGHRGAVLDVAADDARGLLFSVGADGFLRVWDSVAATLVRRIAVTRLKAQSIALDPAAPLAAVVVTDGVRTYAVDVWDWDAEKRLYSIPIQGAPLFVRFSLSGTYLLCGDMQWESLHIFRSREGTTVPFHPEGFGMVGFAEVSRSDATLMTYQPSGRIAYWDIASGNTIKEVETAQGLVNVLASDDRSILVGQSGSEMVGIDAVSGETRFRFDASGFVSLDISGDAGQVACLASDGSLQVRSTSGDAPLPSPAPEKFDWRPHLVRMTADGLLLAGDDGQIGILSHDGRAKDFARDILATVDSIAARGHKLAVAAEGVIRVFLLGESGPGMSPVTESFSLPNPYRGPVGLEFLDSQNLLVWEQGSGAGSLGTINLSTRKFNRWAFSFDGPLTTASVVDGTLFTLEKNGEVEALDTATGAELYKTSWPGAICIAPLGGESLVLGRLSGGSVGSSLVHIDLRTGETAPLPDSSALTFALAPDFAGGRLYSLGVSLDGRTSLTLYEGEELQKAAVLYSADGEYTSASLSIDPTKDFLYTSLGREVVKMWTGGSLESLADSARGTLTLCALDGLLASLQRDSTVSLWDTTANRAFADIYPFADGSWAAVMADGTILGSPVGQRKVGILVRGQLWENGEKSALTPLEQKPAAP